MIDCQAGLHFAGYFPCWADRHQDEIVSPNIYAIVLEPNPTPGQRLVARKTYDLPCNLGVLGSCPIGEKTAINVFHTPGG
jgi:hypothetical protein